MFQVLAALDVLHQTHDSWIYRVRDYLKLHNEYYIIDLMIDYSHKIVISNTSEEEYVDVWCDTQDSHEDGFRVKKTALLEYLIYIIKEEYDI